MRERRGCKGVLAGQDHPGEIRNTGDVAIGQPVSRIVFYDASTAIGSASCRSYRYVLHPGESAACAALVPDEVPTAARPEGRIGALTPPGREVVELLVLDTKLGAPGARGGRGLTGKVTNTGAVAAHRIRIAATVRGAAGEILWLASAYPAAEDLAPGESSVFWAYVDNTAASPAKLEVHAGATTQDSPRP